jgi:nucleotide-binding universal stress UspA family protein
MSGTAGIRHRGRAGGVPDQEELFVFKTILTPIDGSKHASVATTVASDLATKYGARLILLHVVAKGGTEEALARLAELESVPTQTTARRVEHLEATPQGPVAIPGGAETQVDRQAAATQAAHRFLEQTKEALNRQGLEDISALVEHEDPAQSILEVARREKADAVVMGSRGLSDLKGVLLGSVSHKVANDFAGVCVTVTAGSES